MEAKNKSNLKTISIIVFVMLVLASINVTAAKKFESIKNVSSECSIKKEYKELNESFGADDTLKAGLQKAQNLARQGKKDEASEIYTKLMNVYPNNKEIVQEWLILNMKRQPTGEEEAIQTLTDLAALHPNNTAIVFWRMFLEAEHGQNEAALKDIDYLIKLQPDSAINWIAKGQVCAGMQRYEEAATAFNKATTLNPKRGDVWGMKAGVLAKLGQLDNALESVNKGIELMPGDPVGIYNRACIYCLKANKANALADLKKAIGMNPQFKQQAKNDEDFRSLYEDVDFKKITD